MEATTRELDHCDNLVGDEDSLNTKLALVKVQFYDNSGILTVLNDTRSDSYLHLFVKKVKGVVDHC